MSTMPVFYQQSCWHPRSPLHQIWSCQTKNAIRICFLKLPLRVWALYSKLFNKKMLQHWVINRLTKAKISPMLLIIRWPLDSRFRFVLLRVWSTSSLSSSGAWCIIGISNMKGTHTQKKVRKERTLLATYGIEQSVWEKQINRLLLPPSTIDQQRAFDIYFYFVYEIDQYQ